MRVLVTGGAGYIGSIVTAALLGDGHEVTVLDSLVRGLATAAAPAPLVVGDIRDRALVARILREERIEAVMHLAALKSVAESMRDPAAYHEANVVGTRRLLEAMDEAGCRVLVFSSTCAVHGDTATVPVDEATPIAPINPYGESKAQAERLVAESGLATRTRWVTLRYFNVAGAAQDGRHGERWDDAECLVPRVLRVAAGLDPSVPIFGTDFPTPDGTGVRDYVHVEDIASAHLHALQYVADGGDPITLGLGTGRGHSVREVIEAVRAVTGRDVPVKLEPRREGDPAAVWADPTRAAAVLGWTATRDLEAIVATAWRWHQRADGQ